MSGLSLVNIFQAFLHESLETFFPGLADGTGQGRFLPRAQITANLAAPDGVW